SLSFDDLYNNLRVFENDVKGSTASSSNLKNVAFVSENTSSTNDVSTAYGVCSTSGHNSKHEQTSSYSLLASQSSCPQLDHEDLDQVDEYNLEEMDLKWQVVMISMRIKKFYKKTAVLSTFSSVPSLCSSVLSKISSVLSLDSSVPSTCSSVLTSDSSVLTIGLSVLTFSKSVLTPSLSVLTTSSVLSLLISA
ncbi:hypothetical protein Tco_0170821, partial [Tanacetum coccineum]